MRYPAFLKKNGTIGFVAPSLGCATEPYISRFASAQQKLSALGHTFKFGPNCSICEGIGISNTPTNCGEELNSMYKSADCDAIISCGGGEMMCEVVPFMDFDGIRATQPKWYMGYSDNTNFTFTSATLADTAAIYGPCIGDFGMEPWHPAISDAYALLTGSKLHFKNYDKWELDSEESAGPNDPYHVTEPTIMKAFCADTTAPITFEGRLIGGCMDCLENLIGTPYDKVTDFADRYREDGIIWFLESCELNVFSIRRTIWHMKAAGWFQHVKGFLIGRPGIFGEELFGLDQYKAVTDLLSEYNVPILMDLDIGHHPPMIPMLCGGYAKVEFSEEKNEFGITYELK
ncbi:Muramoyltetrapeptide carboxypeptidase LdcA (peptidoglycan recycling) [Lachnospiraceae bacterium XBB1006]|nr:Muramoyltetrapeptide carboxypeptidase LdcA (peptidoglycan recycling) [Lachnospiraceae bacterium XBB1006]